MRSILILALLATPTMADHCRTNHVVSNAQLVTVLPYVPVANPIVFYSIGGYQPAPSQIDPQVQAAQQQDAQKVFGDFEAYMAQKYGLQQSSQATVQAAPVSLSQKHCAACHGPTSDKSLARKGMILESLTDTERVDAAAAIESDTMPPSAKKNPLPRSEKDALIREFLSRPKAAKTEWKASKVKTQELPPEPAPKK